MKRWMIPAVAHCKEGCCSVGGAFHPTPFNLPTRITMLAFSCILINLRTGKVEVLMSGSFPDDFVYVCPEKNTEVHVTTKAEDPSWVVYRILPNDPHVFVLVCPACWQQHKVRQRASKLTVETVNESSIVL